MSTEHDLAFAAPASWPARDGGLRRRARALSSAASGRLRLAASRAGGETGLAVVSALLDMIEGDGDPAFWPVAEAIAILRRAADRDHQINRLLTGLHDIEDRIATLSADPDDGEIAKRPAI